MTLVSGMPPAAGCEGNLLPGAAGCGPFLCQRLPDVSVVVQLGLNRLCGALTTPHPIFVSGDGLQVCPAALPETSIYASGRVVFALPEGAGCGPNFCRRWPKFLPETRVKYGGVSWGFHRNEHCARGLSLNAPPARGPSTRPAFGACPPPAGPAPGPCLCGAP